MQDDDRRTVAANIRAELARKGKNQSALAGALGMHRQAMSQRLLGRTRLSAEELGRIAAYLEVSADLLLAGTDDRVAA